MRSTIGTQVSPLRARSAEYLHRHRQAKLSDHAPLFVVFEPDRAPR